MFCRRLLCLWLSFFLSLPSWAQNFETFIVEDIRVEGLRRFSPGVIFTRIPIDIGDTLSAQKITETIDSLYETGYFRLVDVLRDEDVLVIRVEENPTISEVTVSGAQNLDDGLLQQLLESANISEASVFNRSVLEEATRVIEEGYADKNFYQAKVEAIVSPLPRNRVAILFDIDEGPEAAVRSITILGNEEFSTWRLRRDMRLETKNVLNFFTDKYRFSEGKLNSDLSRIRTRYLEAGFLRFEVEARQVEVSADKQDIDIIIRLNEGRRFEISDIRFELVEGANPLPFELEMFRRYVRQENGDIYNGQVSGEVTEEIEKSMGNVGYARGVASIDTHINDETGTVEIVYVVDPKEIVFVREILITGNEFTSDEVIRRELLQFEKERYSLRKVSQSQDRLRRLGYFSRANFNIEPVDGSPEEVDLILEVEEINTGEISLGAGFRSDGGISFNAGFKHDNIFGTGNDFSALLEHSEDSLEVRLEFDERYYTQEGVNRHIAVSYGDEEAEDDSSAYSIDGYKGEFGFDYPVADSGTYNIYLAYEQIDIKNSSSLNSAYQPFVNQHGDNFDSILLEMGFNFDDRDSLVNPTRGHRAMADLELAVPLLELEYYYLNFLYDFYHSFRSVPLAPVMHTRLGYGVGDGYGDGIFPFYRRFLLGGSRTLRGFDTNSIGYENDSSNRALGGKSRLYGGVEFSIDSELFEEQQIFLVPFFDVGAVGRELGLGSFRASWGIELRWISPLGPLRFSYVEALKSETEDDIETFQFSVSTF